MFFDLWGYVLSAGMEMGIKYYHDQSNIMQLCCCFEDDAQKHNNAQIFERNVSKPRLFAMFSTLLFLYFWPLSFFFLSSPRNRASSARSLKFGNVNHIPSPYFYPFFFWYILKKS